jgi:hypothetical protein
MFAYRTDGVVVALPYAPVVGANRLDSETNGRKLVREIESVRPSGEGIIH